MGRASAVASASALITLPHTVTPVRASTVPARSRLLRALTVDALHPARTKPDDATLLWCLASTTAAHLCADVRCVLRLTTCVCVWSPRVDVNAACVCVHVCADLSSRQSHLKLSSHGLWWIKERWGSGGCCWRHRQREDK